MNGRFAAASMVVTALSLAGASPSAAQGQEAHAFNAPLVFTVTNPCTAEPVALEGNVDLLVQITTPHEDDFIFKTHLATTGRGFGTVTGVNYAFGSEFDQETHMLTRPDNLTNTQKQAVHLASAGRDDNFILLLLIHTTFNGNGAGAEVANITCKCAGAGGAAPGPEVSCVAPTPDPR